MKRSVLCGGAVLVALGCGGGDDNPLDGGADTGGADTGGADTGGTDGGGGTMHATATGQLTFTISGADLPEPCTANFDVDAEEDDTSPWLCPECDTTLTGSVTSTSSPGCVSEFSPAVTGRDSPNPTHATLGWSADGTFYFGFGDNAPGLAWGTMVQTGDSMTVTLENGIPTRMLTGSGTFTLGTASGPAPVSTPADTYTCGWSMSGRPPYTGDYHAAVDALIPDAFLTDACGETVRLHDVLGDGWTVVVMNATESSCAPCNAFAAAQNDAVAMIETDLGVDVTVVTILVESYVQSLWEPGPAVLSQYAEDYAIDGPVLADRGWHAAEHCGLLTSRGMGCYYPANFIVTPEGNVVGFLDTTWDEIESTIRREM